MSGTCDGLLAVDKPSGPTSHDVVAWVRAATRAPRVGHTGTLDPEATGLLLLVVGAATRLARFVPASPKTYRGVLVLGVTTATDDLTGEVVRRFEGALPDAAAVVSAASKQIGRQLQVPPAFSARQVGGTRLYKAARRGVQLEAKATEVVVFKLDVFPNEAPDRFHYEMVVSAGTYVRSIVRDLGKALGCGAAVASLRREAIGPLSVDAALSLPADRAALREAVLRSLIPIDRMPLALPSVALSTDSDVVRFSAGGGVLFERAADDEPVLAAVRDASGRLLGVGEWAGTTVRPRVVVPPSAGSRNRARLSP